MSENYLLVGLEILVFSTVLARTLLLRWGETRARNKFVYGICKRHRAAMLRQIFAESVVFSGKFTTLIIKLLNIHTGHFSSYITWSSIT